MKLPNLANKVSPASDTPTRIQIHVDETETESLISMDSFKTESQYTKYVEKIIRTSEEYRQYIRILKQEFDLGSCKFFTGVDYDASRVTLEMHHYPATLFDIVQGVRDKIKEEANELASYDTFSIAERVMKLHYQGKVGLVPLTKTAHEMAHNGTLFIPLTTDYVFGNWSSLIDDELIVTDIFRYNLEQIEKMTKDYVLTGVNPTLFGLQLKEVEVVHVVAETAKRITRDDDQTAYA